MENNRLDQEWLVLNMTRELIKLASRGDVLKSTYKNAITFAGQLYPDLMGESSLLRRQEESTTTQEYRQRAELKSLSEGKEFTALQLVLDEIEELSRLIKRSGGTIKNPHLLQKKISQLIKAKKELDSENHEESEVIFKDISAMDTQFHKIDTGKAYRDYQIADNKILRMRVFHPSKKEQESGADFIYERFNQDTKKVSLILIQYKIWSNRKLYLSDKKIQRQLHKMKSFSCDNTLCCSNSEKNTYRFPCCASFLRPTDKLQNPDQKFISTGEHIPICKIDEYKSKGERDANILRYQGMKEISLASDIFQELFNRGKIGSREMDYEELQELYEKTNLMKSDNSLLYYAQEF
ncbi:hypothetical protein [Aquimarina longa]|uniref:hypothetical protein n=1 Tax=Aquimarina longa TaxID=1080221 RepID=UPI000784DEDA|nr:hypothetical protein [Aquimarina longa]